MPRKSDKIETLDDLIIAYLEGIATGAQRERLEALLVEDEAACLRFNALSMQALELADLLSSPAAAKPAAQPHVMRWLAAAAAIAVAAFVAWPEPGAADVASTHNPSHPAEAQEANPSGQSYDDRERAFLHAWGLDGEALRIVGNTLDAEWGGDRLPLHKGDGLPAEMMTLRSGLAQFHSGGVQLVVEGPATFRFTPEYNVQLKYGRLLASVAPSASGFTVHTPSGDVVDIGTVFGVHAERQGRVHADVLKGSVRVEPAESDASRLLRAGDGISFLPGSAVPRSAVVDSQSMSYVRELPMIDGIVSTRGAMKMDYSRPPLRPSNATIFIRTERQPGTLPKDVPVTFLDSSSAYTFTTKSANGGVVPKGTRMRSYSIYFGPVSKEPSRWVKTSGSVTFERPIIGVICSHELLAKSDRMFGGALADLAGTVPKIGFIRRGLDKEDSITISPDGRTLQLNLQAYHMDQIRVLVKWEK
jgi:hypothetical protein